MPIGLPPSPKLNPIDGIRLGAVKAGFRYPNRLDLSLIEICAGASVAGVFTKNAFCAAPVQVAREHLKSSAPRYLVINSGNANAGTGSKGMEAARRVCRELAERASCAEESVLPFSTGVIGEPLPVERITQALPALLESLTESGWSTLAKGIMTTDTVPKGISIEVPCEGGPLRFTGVCKGSGMIHPNMATMLSYIATNAEVEPEFLQQCFRKSVEKSFNSITVDGDTSTNDSAILIATGKSSIGLIKDESSVGYELFQQTLDRVCVDLATQLIKDAEGVNKFITITVDGATTYEEAKNTAYTIALSPLVKTALFASDPNWGRILAAVGRSGIQALDVEKVGIYLNGLCIVSHGARDARYTEEKGQVEMEKEEILIRIELNRGSASSTVWTSDLSFDYVRINAEYRS